MIMDHSSVLQHQQITPPHSLDDMLLNQKASQIQDHQLIMRKPRPVQEQPLKCPRCDSTNTKFCYYNNYSLTQPRYFCKSCRRYWTKGGTLRNVPVGGGCRKNHKRSSSSSSSKRAQQDNHDLQTNTSRPTKTTATTQFSSSLPYDCNDLSVAFARLQKQSSGQNYSGLFDIDQTAQNGFDYQQNVYYGFDHHQYQVNLGMTSFDEDQIKEISKGTTTAVTVTTMKQEVCNNNNGDINRSVLWGFPWQNINGDQENVNENLGRESWINYGINGLLNSPLI